MTRLSSKLSEPLTQQQVDIANQFHRQLPRWQLSNQALFMLRGRAPEWDVAACLLKTVTINSLYGTNVYATIPMAEHIASVIAGADGEATTLDELVERIARPTSATGSSRNFISFASKFCHFFIDEEQFPICDGASRRAIGYHLGSRFYMEDRSRPYAAFRQNLQRLRDMSHIKCSHRQLDHYLWITGLYMDWLNEKKINVEMSAVLMNPSRSQAYQLNAFLPAKLPRPFLIRRGKASAARER
jgi:hypothetical protein